MSIVVLIERALSSEIVCYMFLLGTFWHEFLLAKSVECVQTVVFRSLTKSIVVADFFCHRLRSVSPNWLHLQIIEFLYCILSGFCNFSGTKQLRIHTSRKHNAQKRQQHYAKSARNVQLTAHETMASPKKRLRVDRVTYLLLRETRRRELEQKCFKAEDYQKSIFQKQLFLNVLDSLTKDLESWSLYSH